MELYITPSGRMNFTQMAMYGRSCGSRFRQNFKKPFDWIVFNKHFVDTQSRDCIAIAIDPCFVPKSGKKTPELGWLCFRLCTADAWAVSLGREARVVIVEYIDSGKKRQIRKVFCTDLTKFVEDIFDIYRARFQPEYVFRDAKQFTGLKHCQTRNKEAISFAFNTSLLSVNLARAYARKEGDSLSVGVTKTLMLSAVMLERFNSMSAKQADRRLNNTDFKELLFYGIRIAG